MNTPVNFEIAKLLKEKGFDRKTSSCYYKDGDEEINSYLIYYGNYKEQLIDELNNSDKNIYIEGFDYNIDPSRYSAPTIADVVMWCFNKYKYSIEYSMNIPESGEYDGCYVFNGLIKGSEDYKLKIFYTSKDYPTVEKALEDTINHFLINFC